MTSFCRSNRSYTNPHREVGELKAGFNTFEDYVPPLSRVRLVAFLPLDCLLFFRLLLICAFYHLDFGVRVVLFSNFLLPVYIILSELRNRLYNLFTGLITK